jgi:hypothetical protein
MAELVAPREGASRAKAPNRLRGSAEPRAHGQSDSKRLTDAARLSNTRNLLDPSSLEEPVQQLGCIRCEEALFHLDAVIQEVGISQAEFTADGSEPEVSSPENKPFDTGKHNGTGAHNAGLQSHVNCAI